MGAYTTGKIGIAVQPIFAGLGFSNITLAGHGVPSPLPSTFQSASNSSQQAEAKGEGHAQTFHQRGHDQRLSRAVATVPARRC
jgi:hypothetical protein